ncbi:MAG TPA: hypothetical protein VJ810_22545 [Blastocatellia bacterium]|nr:hypothetical protein [Blastocatellia bacterium]
MIDAQQLYIAPTAAGRIQQRALIVGAMGLILCVVGAIFRPALFLQSYLFAYLFTLGLALGSMAILMLQYLTGGDWGVVVRRVLEAAMRTLPWLAAGFLPVALGVRELYVWARPAQAAALGLDYRTEYLNVPFFIARAVLYFAVWLAMARLLDRWSREQDRGAALGWLKRLRRLSGPGLVIYAVTITFAAYDWLMSLNPEWYSTIFGLLIIAGQALSAVAFAILVAALLSTREPMAVVLQPRHFHDLGKLMLAFVMVWAYLSFSQLLIVWSGNLPQEIPFYLPRMQSSWRWVGILLIVLHFALPFALLLSRDLKRRAGSLAALAGLVIVMRVTDLFWLVAPEFRRQGLAIDWFDPVTVVGLCGLWLALFTRELRTRPMLPLRDPHLVDALSAGEQYSVNRRE